MLVKTDRYMKMHGETIKIEEIIVALESISTETPSVLVDV